MSVIDNIDSGNSNLSNEDCEDLILQLSLLTKGDAKLSKYQAIKYLNISRATFDSWVRSGKLPKGRKQQGFKEKFWLKSDLNNVK